MLVPEDAARFAERLRALVETPPAHRAIIRGVEAGLDRSTPYLALEYAPGESLDSLLRQSGAWPVSRALPVLREVAAAIDASWNGGSRGAAGAGHGALHPRDIFVAFAPTDVRVTGFGIGAALESLGAKAPVRRPYSAPERGSDPWDIRSDVYSLGVVAFEMLSGQRPVGTDDAAALVPDQSADTRAAVQRVLAVAMADTPADRYENATALVNALEEVAGHKHKLDMPAAPPVVALASDSELADEEQVKPEPLVAAAIVEPPKPIEPSPVKKIDPAPTPSIRPRTPVVDHPIDLPLKSNPRPERPQAAAIGSFLGSDGGSESSSSFPWLAVGAVFIAGLVLAGVVMYQFGWSRGHSAAVREAVQTATPTPTPLNVSASPEPSATPATSSPTVAAPPPVGRLVIQSTPAGALVTIDGRRRGETPVTVQVPLGKHEIQLARSGYLPVTRRVELTRKSLAQTVRVPLQRGPADGTQTAAKTQTTGWADVDSQPRGARVSVDGKFVGVTPMRVSDLPAGEHSFLFELAGHKSVTSKANIVGGQRTPVAVRLVEGVDR